MEEDAAGVVGKLSQNVRVALIRGKLVLHLVALQIGAPRHHQGALRSIAQRDRGKQPLGVQAIDDDFVAQRAIHDLADGVFLRFGRKTGRDEDDVALAGERSHPAHQLLQFAEGILGLRLVLGEDAHRLGLGILSGSFLLARIILVTALQRLSRRHVDGIGLVLFHHQVGLVRENLWAGFRLPHHDRPRLKAEERLVNLRSVVGEVLHELARRSEDADPIARLD